MTGGEQFVEAASGLLVCGVDRSGSKTGVRVAREIVQSIYDKGLAPGDRYLSEPDALREHAASAQPFGKPPAFWNSRAL